MTTQAIARRRRPRGLHPKRTDGEPQPKRLPEYLEADEVDAIIRAAEDPRAKLLMLTQWRAGLRVSEALALDVSDLSLDSELPTIRVRSGKGRKARVVPVHPELAAAFRMALSYGNVAEGRLIEAHRSTAWRWVQAAVERAERNGAIAAGRRVGTHTLRHSYARHLLMHGVPINYLSRWLGHSSIQTTTTRRLTFELRCSRRTYVEHHMQRRWKSSCGSQSVRDKPVQPTLPRCWCATTNHP